MKTGHTKESRNGVFIIVGAMPRCGEGQRKEMDSLEEELRKCWEIVKDFGVSIIENENEENRIGNQQDIEMEKKGFLGMDRMEYVESRREG